MTGDEAALLADDIARNWPSHAWPPATVAWWTEQLRTLDHQTARDGYRIARRRHIDPPTWAQFVAACQPDPPTPTEADRSPAQLDLDGHRQALAELRQQHRFLTK